MADKKTEAVDAKLPANANVIEETDDEATPHHTNPNAKGKGRRATSIVGRPNVPSFDTDGGKNPKPKLMKGEKILKEGTRSGVKYVWTSEARMIFLCTIEEYLESVGPLLPSVETYRRWYPQATSSK